MVLAVHSNASYLSEPAARSQAGGHFFCSANVDDPPNNGAVLNISKILRAIMSSAAKVELGALYINAQEAIPMQHLLEEMGHKQPHTPIQTDNSIALGVVTNNIQHVTPKQWTCDSTGYNAVTHRANLDTTGARNPTTEPTTGPNTTARHTTSKNGPQS